MSDNAFDVAGLWLALDEFEGLPGMEDLQGAHVEVLVVIKLDIGRIPCKPDKTELLDWLKLHESGPILYRASILQS